VASTVTRSQSNRAPLGYGGTGDSQLGVQLTNLQQLCDTIMSIWTKISEEYFQHIGESMPQGIKSVLMTKRGSDKVYFIKMYTVINNDQRWTKYPTYLLV